MLIKFCFASLEYMQGISEFVENVLPSLCQVPTCPPCIAQEETVPRASMGAHECWAAFTFASGPLERWAEGKVQ